MSTTSYVGKGAHAGIKGEEKEQKWGWEVSVNRQGVKGMRNKWIKK